MKKRFVHFRSAREILTFELFVFNCTIVYSGTPMGLCVSLVCKGGTPYTFAVSMTF